MLRLYNINQLNSERRDMLLECSIILFIWTQNGQSALSLAETFEHQSVVDALQPITGVRPSQRLTEDLQSLDGFPNITEVIF